MFAGFCLAIFYLVSGDLLSNDPLLAVFVSSLFSDRGVHRAIRARMQVKVSTQQWQAQGRAYSADCAQLQPCSSPSARELHLPRLEAARDKQSQLPALPAMLLPDLFPLWPLRTRQTLPPRPPVSAALFPPPVAQRGSVAHKTPVDQMPGPADRRRRPFGYRHQSGCIRPLRNRSALYLPPVTRTCSGPMSSHIHSAAHMPAGLRKTPAHRSLLSSSQFPLARLQAAETASRYSRTAFHTNHHRGRATLAHSPALETLKLAGSSVIVVNAVTSELNTNTHSPLNQVARFMIFSSFLF